MRQMSSIKNRPEKTIPKLTWLDSFLRGTYRTVLFPILKLFINDGHLVKKIIKQSDIYTALSEEDFLAEVARVKLTLLSCGLNNKTVIESFALIREAAGRSVGMRHHHTQIRASLILLQGMVAEMATGEGKTLAGTLATATAAMAGVKVHVITTNDYLAERDCEEMLPLYSYLGLRAQAIINEHTIEDRKAIYAGDIVYCSNNELVFDYLKDSLVLDERQDSLDIHRQVLEDDTGFLNNLMHQGLNFALVDEADSVFIDESRTPLVISGGEVDMDDEEDFLRTVLDVARNLVDGKHYEIDWPNRKIVMLKEGGKAAEEICLDLNTPWYNLIRRQQMLTQALTALYLFDLDKHYIVDDDKIVIVDEYTGRPAGDRSWEGGLHQLIEIKEGCPLTKPRKTLAKISYQNFFKKYFNVAGMTGTAKEVRSELLKVYNLPVKKVPLLKKSLRKITAYTVLRDQPSKEKVIVDAAVKQALDGRSVLIGTASVHQSESLAAIMDEMQQPYFLLTAKQDGAEAEIISDAGVSGAITIATSMAGRGTDIKLDKECREAGGLHVIICELNDSARVDRQLAGRSARQGDPGSVEYILALDDSVVRMYGKNLSKLVILVSGKIPFAFNFLARWLQRYCQWRLELKHAGERKMTLKMDEKERSSLAFLGGSKWH
jgi:preprotein translocase subunit SecA